MFGRRRKEQVLVEVIEKLLKQNEKLLDRLMAKDLPELKTYTVDEGIPSARTRISYPDEDDMNAGEVLNVE